MSSRFSSGVVAAAMLSFVVPTLSAKDVYGNNIPWTVHDDIIRDIQRDRARAEARSRNSYSGKSEMEMWLEGKKEARENLRRRIADSLNPDKSSSDGAETRQAKPTPVVTAVPYEVWAEEKDLAAANRGDAEAMERLGRRMLETGRTSGLSWMEKAAEKGNGDAMLYLLRRARGERGGTVNVAEQKRWLRQIVKINAGYNGRWHYAAELVALYETRTTPQEARELASMLEELLASPPDALNFFHAEAAHALAQLYAEDTGVPRNLDRAIELERRAIAQQKTPAAMYLLALSTYLEKTDGGPLKHRKEIVDLILAACRAPSPGVGRAADRYFALLEEDGVGVSKYVTAQELNYRTPFAPRDGKAREALVRAMREGSYEAGERYLTAIDQYVLPLTPKEIPVEESVNLSDLAQKLGHPRAWGIRSLHTLNQIDGLYYAKLGIEQNDPTSYYARAKHTSYYAPAKAWPGIVEDYKKAAQGGMISAMIKLSEHYESGLGIEQETQAARFWMNRAATLGSVTARVRWAWWQLTSTDYLRNPELAVELLEDGVKQNIPAAMALLGGVLCEGKLLPEDRVRGYALLQKAADYDDNDAKAWLGLCARYGWGRSVDREQARRYFKQAMGGGSLRAAVELTSMIYTTPRPDEQKRLVVEVGKGEHRNAPDAAFYDELEEMRMAMGRISYLLKSANFSSRVEGARFLLSLPNSLSPVVGLRNTPIAEEILSELAELGHPEAQFRYGQCHMLFAVAIEQYNSSDPETLVALKSVQAAAKQGHVGAVAQLAAWKMTDRVPESLTAKELKTLRYLPIEFIDYPQELAPKEELPTEPDEKEAGAAKEAKTADLEWRSPDGTNQHWRISDFRFQKTDLAEI